jgi:hypothetical protein
VHTASQYCHFIHLLPCSHHDWYFPSIACMSTV